MKLINKRHALIDFIKAYFFYFGKFAFVIGNIASFNPAYKGIQYKVT